jgi:TPR repeat protein
VRSPSHAGARTWVERAGSKGRGSVSAYQLAKYHRPDFGAGIAAQADVSPTGSVDRGVQRTNAAPADAVAGVSRSPNPSLPKNSLSSAVEARLVARAKSLIADARLLLKYGSDKGSARATFMLAETYDSQTLRSLQAYGVSGDTAMARKLYELAAAAGIDQARERLEALNLKPEH